MSRIDAVRQFELVAKRLSESDVECGLDSVDGIMVLGPFPAPLENAPNWKDAKHASNQLNGYCKSAVIH